MAKMATSRDLAHLLDLERPLPETLKLMAKEKGTDVGDLVVIMLDRPRHEAMSEIRCSPRCGPADLRLVADVADVAVSRSFEAGEVQLPFAGRYSLSPTVRRASARRYSPTLMRGVRQGAIGSTASSDTPGP
jgi:hypothetical protein